MTTRPPSGRASIGVALALAVAVAAALSGCGSSGSSGAANPTPAFGDEAILAIGREYSQCIRDHGVVGFPDMVLVDDLLVIPEVAGSDINAAEADLKADGVAHQACQPVLDRLPPSAVKDRALSAQDITQLLAFAQCLRDNGVPDWPDPHADGSFPLVGTPLETEGKSPRLLAAMQNCRQHWDKGIPLT